MSFQLTISVCLLIWEGNTVIQQGLENLVDVVYQLSGLNSSTETKFENEDL